MRKALFASALLLVLAGGLSWGASAADLKPLDSTQGAAFTEPTEPMPSPVQRTACTVTCWFDPSISCTSQTGNCQHQDLKGTEIIKCDGVVHLCPGI